MPYQIENLTMRPVIFSLTTGETLRLSPRSTSSELRDAEVINNTNIQDLVDQRILALYEIQEQKKTPAATGIEEERLPQAAPVRRKAESTK